MGRKKKPLWTYSEYPQWAQSFALTYTRKELEVMLARVEKELKRASASNRRAIERTTSMQSMSQARAHAGNSVYAASQKSFALKDALEIYQFYPEKTKEGVI